MPAKTIFQTLGQMKMIPSSENERLDNADMCPKGSDNTANSVVPDQTAPVGAV